MRFGAENSFPMGALVEITLYDEQYKSSKVLLENFEVSAGSNAVPFSNISDPYILKLNSQDLEELPSYSFVVIEVTLDTDGDFVVKDHLFKLRAGVKIFNE